MVWRPLTTRAAPTLQADMEMIDLYRAQRNIDPFFLMLKEGFRIEVLQLGDDEQLWTAVAQYMVD